MEANPLVLAIDDEPGIIRLCQRLLERAQFRVLAVTDAREGVAILENELVDLLLVDIRMPGLDGFGVIDLARRRRPDLAVVIMTGYGTVETALEALRRGADALVLKPFAGAELVQSVKRALQDSRRKQDLLRLQTLRPLFTVSEGLFRQTDPARLQEMLLDTVLTQLKCAHAGIYRVQGGAEIKSLLQVAGRGALGAEEPAWWENSPGAGDPGTAPAGTPSRSVSDLGAGGRDAAPGSAPAADPVPEAAPETAPETAPESAPKNTPESDPSALGRAARWGIPVRVEGHPALLSRGLGSMMAASLVLLPAAQKPGEGYDLLLAVARNAAEPAFRESDLEIFAILSRQAAIALENARLHAELRAYLHQVEESQKALIKAEKLAIAGRLTASIAHEINNPLQAVQNCLHLAGRMELAEADRQNYIQMAQAELERLMNTVHRMLDYYRPGAVDRQTVEVNALIQRVLLLLEKQLADHRIQVELSLEEELPAVWAVSDQIQQVLLNLILNAVEAMPSGGTIYIRTRLPAGSDPLQVEVMVEDTGPGVEKNRRERVFEPFISSKEGGTGLGLAISYGIIAAHGGSLDLVHGRGRGACFRMVLPAEAGKPAEAGNLKQEV